MKILELTRSYYPSIGGMEKFVADRIKIYKGLDIDFQIVTTNHSEKKLKTNKLKDVIYLKNYTPYDITPGLKKIFKLEFDILSVNQVGYFYSDYSIYLAHKKNKKIILTPHFYFHTKRFKLIKYLHFKFIVPKLLIAVDKIICFTKLEAEFWIKNFQFVEEKIVIIPHYFSPPKIKVKNMSDKYGKFILFLGRGEVNKRIDLLIKAFNRIESYYHLVLTIYADEISQELQNIVTKNRRIHLLGRVSEGKKQSLLSSCNALILPTDFEAFGIVNFEASYYRTPLLLSNLEVFKKILNNGGIIYFNNDVKSLVKVIRKFIGLNNKQKSEMGEKNYINLERYSFERIKEKYHNILFG